MADRNVSRRQVDDRKPPSSTEQGDPACARHPDVTQSHIHVSTGREQGSSVHDPESRVSNPDLSHSPSLRPGSAARDSGYNTDVSPATTISPATNTPRQQHFVFDDFDQSRTITRDHDSRLPTIGFGYTTPPLPACNVATSPLAQCSYPPNPDTLSDQRNIRSRSTPPLRLSPDIFKASPAPGSQSWRGPQTSSSRPLSEASDTNRVQFDFESEDEDGDDKKQTDSSSSSSFLLAPPPRSVGQRFDLSGNLLDLRLPDVTDDDDYEDVFYKNGEILKHWGVSSEPQTPRYRSSSLSLRQRRYCSATDDDDSLLGACGGSDASEEALYFSGGKTHDQRSHSFSESRGGRRGSQYSDVRQVVSGSVLAGHTHGHVYGDGLESPLTRSQGFQPGDFDTSESRRSDSEVNVFSFDPEDIDAIEENDRASAAASAAQRPVSGVPTVRDKPPISPASRLRRRRVGVALHLRLSNGCLLPWSSSIGGVSVSTQTPHMTSVMIQQILETPVPVPNEARGTAASRLRRLSEGGVPMPPSPVPLPDIIPVGRDRSLSVPDFQALARRQRAQEVGRRVGRELRRLSDEFNFSFSPRRNLSPVHEEFDGHPASFPQVRPSRLRSTFSHFGAFLRETFGGRRSSSVDLVGQAASAEPPDQSEEDQGE